MFKQDAQNIGGLFGDPQPETVLCQIAGLAVKTIAGKDKLTPAPPPAGQNTGADSPQFSNPNYGGNLIAPADIAPICDALPAIQNGVTGAGVSIAIVGRSKVALSDAASFRAMFGLPVNLPQIILDGPDPGIAETGSSYDDEAEANVNLQYAGSIAPQATIDFRFASMEPVSTPSTAMAALPLNPCTRLEARRSQRL